MVRDELVELGEVVLVDRPLLVPGAEVPLRLDGEAADEPAAE